MNSNAVRLGGLCGVGAAGAAIPAYVVGSPELPNTAGKLASYYDEAVKFIAANGTIPLVHLLLGIAFVAVLAAILRSAMGPEPAVYMVLIGGAVFFALTAAGLAAEVAIPAVIATFGDVVAVDSARPFLGLSVWLYHYSQIGAAIMMFATAYAIWRTEVFPKWAAAGGLLGLVALSHTWVGVPAAYGTVAWFALMGLLLLALPPFNDIRTPATRGAHAKRADAHKAAAPSTETTTAASTAVEVPPRRPMVATTEDVPLLETPSPPASSPTADAAPTVEVPLVEKPSPPPPPPVPMTSSTVESLLDWTPASGIPWTGPPVENVGTWTSMLQSSSSEPSATDRVETPTGESPAAEGQSSGGADEMAAVETAADETAAEDGDDVATTEVADAAQEAGAAEDAKESDEDESEAKESDEDESETKESDEDESETKESDEHTDEGEPK